MNKSRIFQIVGLVLVLIGLFALLSSFPDNTKTETFTIPSGAYFYRFQAPLLYDGEVHGNFTVTAGDPVKMMIFTEPEYKKYEQTGVAVPIFTTSGSSGTFSAKEAGTGTLYMVFAHTSDAYENTTDTQITYTLSGVAITFLVPGIILVGAGVAMAVLSRRFRRAEIASAPPSPVATDVTLFKDQTPPGSQP